MNREYLDNGCSFTNPIVQPKNWDKGTPDTEAPWRIRYRYFDPVLAPAGRQFSIRDMNQYKTLGQRREVVRGILTALRIRLLKDGWNPISNKEAEISAGGLPPMNFIAALNFAHARLECGERTKKQVRHVVAHAATAIRALGYDMPISEVRRKHVRFVLDRIGANKQGWTAHGFNLYRTSFKMLFNILNELEATEIDPISGIKKMQTVIKVKQTLTEKEREKINKHLIANFPAFYRFVHIFFHSGARISELMRLRGADVDLAGQRFKVAVIKGKRKTEVWKTIKDIALPFWGQLRAKPNQFVFSLDLVPGEIPLNPVQLSRRWRHYVKVPLGITAGLYSLKHLSTTQTVDLLSVAEAAAHNSHAGEAMVLKIYDTKRGTRERDRIKSLNNPL